MTTSSIPAIVHVTGSGIPDGIVRLWVPTGVDVTKQQLIQHARKVAGTIDVGSVPVPRSAKLRGVSGHGYDFSPVVHRNAKDTTPTERQAAAVPADSPLVGALVALGLSPQAAATAAAAVAGFGGGTTASTASRKGKGKTTAKRDNGFRDFLAGKAKARDERAARCPRCLGFGKERTHPRESAKYPYAFTSQHGADTSVTGVECSACHGASTGTTAKGKGKRAS